ncbi:response regulator transcription factor [Pannus brasiliensis CCIBt3594]|uniref:Response regulator transcription factor n=1 Tax=Pannus brasiliensis CCIBt3594 TaxID=1427578 RepID=A0AAW9QQV5_9CHRO
MLTLDNPALFPNSDLPTPHRILIVEDEDLIRDMIVLALQEEGYEAIGVKDGRSALEILQNNDNPNLESRLDLVILDVMLPHINGLDICRLLRHHGNIIPILILSAKASETDRVLGLEVGADDYLTKPFSMRELIARCRALIRRQGFTSGSAAPVRKYRDVTLSTQECRVIVRGEEINLSPKEFRLLDLFMSYPRRVWSREQLIEQVWGPDFLGDTKTVDVHIRWLREKLELDPGQPEYLITVRGFGYRFG